VIVQHPLELQRFVDAEGNPQDVEKSHVRDAFGEALAELGARHEFVVLGADLDKSTKTLKFRDRFGEFGKAPWGAKGRWISCGVSEAFLCAAAGGLAARGIKPVITTFARFLERGYEPLIQSVAIPGFDAFVVGSHGGIATGQDGSSAQAIEDVALFRALPNATVLCPADAHETRQAVFRAFDEKGIVYLRLSRNRLPHLFDGSYEFRLGAVVELLPGEGLTLVGTGETTYYTLLAAARLRREQPRLRPRVLHAPTIRPLSAEALGQIAQDTDLFVTVEDHSPRGGLGDAVLEALSEAGAPRRVLKIGVDVYARSCIKSTASTPTGSSAGCARR